MAPEARAVRASAYIRGLLSAGGARLVQTGCGKPLPASIRPDGCSAVLVAGVCGAIAEGLVTGDRLLPEKVISGMTGKSLLLHGGVWGNLVTVPHPVDSPLSRLNVRRRFSGDVVDMESYPIALWCRSADIPCCVARIVADSVHGPKDASAMHRVNRDAALLLTDFVEIVVKNIVENRPPGTGTQVVSKCTRNSAES